VQWTGLIVVVTALAAASAYGLLRRSRQGRIKQVPAVSQPAAAVDAEAALLTQLGVAPDQVTLLQFSSAFCAPCRATRAILAEVARTTDGVAHVEVDAESQLDAVRALDIWRTPTTLIIDTAGRIVGRAQGLPNRGQVVAAVTPLLPGHTQSLQGQAS
jgi:thiol-disulfide isomerase/thioredoxin